MFKIINKINFKLFLITFYILFFSCDKNDKKPKKNIELSKKSELITKIKKEEKFKLSDENVMEFFLEYDKHNKENLVRIVTDYGNIEIQLFDNTKFHRSNFIYLTKKNYFEDTQFYRVINNFVIQAGNSDNKKISQKRKKIGRY